MSEKEGLIIFFDEERRSDLIKEYSEGGYYTFSDALSVYDWTVKQNTLALLSFSPNNIDYICIASKGNRVATSKSRINFSEIVNLGEIKVSDIESNLNENIKRYFISSTQGHGGRIPKKTWDNIIEIISNIRPNIASEIARLRSLGKFSGYKLRGQVAETLMQEREALGISLEIFTGNNKLRDSVLGAWAPAEENVKIKDTNKKEGDLSISTNTKSSFLSGISSRYLQEESALQHDLFNWEGMTPFHEAGVSVFESGQRKLEVIYANKNDLEKTLGVDLIYYNDTYKSFILLQYKLMKQDANGEDFYYRPDKQLGIEIERFNKFLLDNPSSNIKNHEEFRLCSDSFLLKLIPNKGLQPASGELIKGMYLTKNYAEFILSEHGPKGDRGGSIITFKNSPRYLTNIEFSQMVNRGWIGTTGITTTNLKTLIHEFYESGRALLVAHESKL